MLNIQKCKALDGSFMRPWDYFMRIYSPFCDLNVSHSNRVTLDSPLGWCAWWGVSLPLLYNDPLVSTRLNSSLINEFESWSFDELFILFQLIVLIFCHIYSICSVDIVLLWSFTISTKDYHMTLIKGIIKSFNSSEEHEESSLLLEMPFNWHGGKKLI